LDGERAPQIDGGVAGTAGIGQQEPGVQRELAAIGRHIARPDRVRDGAVDGAYRGKRPARVAMALNPVRRERDEPLVACGRLFVRAAIAEEPGAEMKDFGVVLDSQGHGAPRALQRLDRTAPIKQGLRQAAVQSGAIGVLVFFSARKGQAGIERAGT
jgi:hypothetical protein